MSSWEACQLI